MSDRDIYTIQHEPSAVQLMCFYVLPSHDHKYPNLNEYKQIPIKIIQLVTVLGYSGRGPGFKFHLTQLVGYHSNL